MTKPSVGDGRDREWTLLAGRRLPQWTPEMPAEVPVVDAVAATLAGLGADTAFGLIGSGNFRLAERLTSRHSVKHYAGRHETAVVTMADAWARATGRVGLCTLHQGPGLTNALTGLVEASRARTPLLVITGEVGTTAIHANQRINTASVAAIAGAGCVRVERGAMAVRDTMSAWRQALTERRPVVLALPVDVQEEPCPPPAPEELWLAEMGAPAPAVDSVERAAELIAAARRPVVLAGRGAVIASAGSALEALADRIGALLTTSVQAHGLFAGHPWSVGICGGFAAPDARELIASADVVVAFGASLNHWTTGHGELIHAGTTVVHCDADPAAIGLHRTPQVAVVGDARECARALDDALAQTAGAFGGYRAQLGGDRVAVRAWPIRDVGDAHPIHPGRLMFELERRIPDDRNVAFDGGHFVWNAIAFLSVPQPEALAFTQAFQSIGLGVASGVGLAIARPDRPTIAVVGDGGLMTSLGELDSAASAGIPLLVVVMDDGAYGAEVHHFGPEGEPTELVTFGTRDFAGVAGALGIPTQTVRTVADLEGALDTWLARPEGPFLLDAKIDPRVRADQSDLAFTGSH